MPLNDLLRSLLAAYASGASGSGSGRGAAATKAPSIPC